MRFGMSFKQPLRDGVLPLTLKHLQLGHDYENKIPFVSAHLQIVFDDNHCKDIFF